MDLGYTGCKGCLAVENLETIIKPPVGLVLHYHHGLGILNYQ